MACGIKLVFMGIFIIFLLKSHTILVAGEPHVPCYFIFGDSLVDNGNNNDLVTSIKANYPPYGIDFVDGPTGRFTNGRTTADYIGDFLGFTKTIPPTATARDEEIMNGVNYGSGGAGILNESGQHLGARISLDRQLFNHQQLISRLAALQQNLTFTEAYMSKCIYTVGMGSNDYVNNYFLPQFYPSSHEFAPDQFAATLIEQYNQQLNVLYKLGARKVAIFGLGFLGCAPAAVTMFATNASPCVDNINNAVELFDSRLRPLVDKLNNELPEAKFTYINISGISSRNRPADGVTVVNAPCCILRADSLCSPNTVPCSNLDQYMYYDGYHPTQIINHAISSRAYQALSFTDAYPVDISHLAQL